MKWIFLTNLLFLALLGNSCQADYFKVGTSSVSIEPGNETISLTLAGYASPNEGRFTLTWDDLGKSDLPLPEERELYPEVVCMTASEDYLFAISKSGQLLRGTLTEDRPEWIIAEDTSPDIISLTCDRNRLYGLTAGNVLLQRSLTMNDTWAKIGYNNGETYTIDAKRIAYLDGAIYAVDGNGHLFKGRHATVGDLTARAMSITKGNNTLVVVGVDVCGFDKSFTDDIKEEICRKTLIRPEAILINASHTHYAPVTQSWITWQPPNQRPDSLYLLHTVRPAIIRAIEESLANSKASDLYLGRGTSDIGQNRRKIKDYDIYDNTLDVLVAVSRENKKKTVLFMAGCHPVAADPQVNSFTMNANFPGYARELIEKDPDIENSIFLQAFAGDINPKGQFRQSGKQLAEDVMRVVNKEILVPVTGNITFFMDTVAIPVTSWSEEKVKAFRTEHSATPGDMQADRNVRWANVMLEYHARGNMPEQMPVYYQTFNIGDWKLVALSREVTTEFGMAIRNLWPEKQVSVLAYSNDVPSYLSTDPHINAGNYEGYDSFFWYGQPSPFPLHTFDRIINSIKETNH